MDETTDTAIGFVAMTKIKLVCAALALMTAGCGDAETCADPQGAFELMTEEVAGDCGDLGTIVIEVGDGVPANCERTETVSDSGCYVERVQTCDQGGGESSTATLEMHISEDGESISGDVGLALRDSGGLVCAGEYEFTGSLLAP